MYLFFSRSSKGKKYIFIYEKKKKKPVRRRFLVLSLEYRLVWPTRDDGDTGLGTRVSRAYRSDFKRGGGSFYANFIRRSSTARVALWYACVLLIPEKASEYRNDDDDDDNSNNNNNNNNNSNSNAHTRRRRRRLRHYQNRLRARTRLGLTAGVNWRDRAWPTFLVRTRRVPEWKSAPRRTGFRCYRYCC